MTVAAFDLLGADGVPVFLESNIKPCDCGGSNCRSAEPYSGPACDAGFGGLASWVADSSGSYAGLTHASALERLGRTTRYRQRSDAGGLGGGVQPYSPRWL